MVENYNIYRFTFRERLKVILEGLLQTAILGYMFYKSLWGIIILSPLCYLHFLKKRNDLIDKRKWQLNIEFRDGINSLSAALNAGYSAEHAFMEAVKDLKKMYPKGSMIINEFAYIANQIKMNITVEKALSDFANRCGIDDIISFAEVFATAKRAGGEITQIIKFTGNIISDKVEIKREIMTLIAAKKFEATIMKYVPVGILFYLSCFSPDLLKPLYHNLFGIIIMTILLGIYLFTYRLIDKIVSIEV